EPVKAVSLDLMSPQGTAAYDGLTDLPPLVGRAVDLARRLGFANSCRPEHGRLLHALAAGAGTIGETGTGCGVGLAWLASGARPGTRLASVEIDTERAGLVASLFADLPHLAVLPGDWREIYRAAPFDLLVLDGGGYPPDPEELLKPGGTVVIDDQARMHWFTHPALDAAELRLAPDLAALVATRRYPALTGRANSRRAGSPGPRTRT